jgi:type II secretory pathway component PulJ
MQEQQQFDFADYRPAVDPVAQGRWLALVHSRRGWITASQCVALMGAGWTGDDRTIRAYAEAAGGQVISGRKGYKHIEHAQTDEIDHFCNMMESQAKRMLDRAIRTRNLAHAHVG